MIHRLIDLQTDPGAGGGDSIGAEGAEPGGRPSWLPDNFKTPEDFARSYDEIRREADRQRDLNKQQEAQFAAAVQEITAAQQAPSQRLDVGSDPRLVAYQDAMDRGDGAAALAITLQLADQIAESKIAASRDNLSPQVEALARGQRDQQIELAEAQAAQYARQVGLDYEASRQEVVDVLRELHGPEVLPLTGDIPSYTNAISRAIDVVFARGVIERDQATAQERREKLSSMTSTPGAHGRVATGGPQEQAEWDAIKGAKTGSYAEVMRGR